MLLFAEPGSNSGSIAWNPTDAVKTGTRVMGIEEKGPEAALHGAGQSASSSQHTRAWQRTH